MIHVSGAVNLGLSWHFHHKKSIYPSNWDRDLWRQGSLNWQYFHLLVKKQDNINSDPKINRNAFYPHHNVSYSKTHSAHLKNYIFLVSWRPEGRERKWLEKNVMKLSSNKEQWKVNPLFPLLCPLTIKQQSHHFISSAFHQNLMLCEIQEFILTSN